MPTERAEFLVRVVWGSHHRAELLAWARLARRLGVVPELACLVSRLAGLLVLLPWTGIGPEPPGLFSIEVRCAGARVCAESWRGASWVAIKSWFAGEVTLYHGLSPGELTVRLADSEAKLGGAPVDVLEFELVEAGELLPPGAALRLSRHEGRRPWRVYGGGPCLADDGAGSFGNCIEFGATVVPRAECSAIALLAPPGVCAIRLRHLARSPFGLRTTDLSKRLAAADAPIVQEDGTLWAHPFSESCLELPCRG